jgi:hypothetical protein
VDAGTEAVILVQAKDFRFRSVSFEFNYAVSGEQYSVAEKYFLGPDGGTWIIVAIAVGSFIGLMIVISFIICLVYCIKRRNRIGQTPGNVSIDHMPLE